MGLEHFLGSEDPWRFWCYGSDGDLLDLSSGTFTGVVAAPGASTGALLTGTFTGAAGAGHEPDGTPNLVYSPATNETFGGASAGRWHLRIVWSQADQVVFDGILPIRAQITGT